MRRFHVYNWNKRDENEKLMVILTEEDIINKSDKYVGAGYEILILPSKYKDVHNEYLDVARLLATVRRGEVIYV